MHIAKRIAAVAVCLHIDIMKFLVVASISLFVMIGCTADEPSAFMSDCTRYMRTTAMMKGAEMTAKTAKVGCTCLSDGMDTEFSDAELPSAQRLVLVGIRSAGTGRGGKFYGSSGDEGISEDTARRVGRITKACTAVIAG